MTTTTFTQTVTIITCSNCAMPFGMTAEFVAQRREDHASFYCPRGHSQFWPQKSDLERQKERADALAQEASLAWKNEQFWRDRAKDERRSASAYRGHMTRIRNKIANGICPVPGCRRNFTNVRDHMATVHPDYHAHEVTE